MQAAASLYCYCYLVFRMLSVLLQFPVMCMHAWSTCGQKPVCCSWTKASTSKPRTALCMQRKKSVIPSPPGETESWESSAHGFRACGFERKLQDRLQGSGIGRIGFRVQVRSSPSTTMEPRGLKGLGVSGFESSKHDNLSVLHEMTPKPQYHKNRDTPTTPRPFI